MRKLIFHVGMGKTGSSTIQGVLSESHAELASKGLAYRGQWMKAIRPEFDGFAGFMNFLSQPPAVHVENANALTKALAELEAAGEPATHIFSNEQYYGEVRRLDSFFKTLAKDSELEFIVFMRPPATWLPSAYIQWGVVHKAHPGAVQSFGKRARNLIRQYEWIKVWHEKHGARVRVIPYHEGEDIVRVFEGAIGAPLATVTEARQVRPAPAEILLRAAFNNTIPTVALPDAFDKVASGIPAGTPQSLSDKLRYVFDYDETQAIIEEHAATWDFIKTTFGLSLTDTPLPKTKMPKVDQILDNVVGTLLDLVFAQQAQLKRLEERLQAVEKRE